MRNSFLPLLLIVSVIFAGCRKPDPEHAPEAEPLPTEPLIPGPPPPAPPPAGTPADEAVPAPRPGSARQDLRDQPTFAGSMEYEAWFRRHGLDLDNPEMLDADADGDGFSNRDEFLAGTDPTDPKSRPGFHHTLRLREYHEVRLPLLLEGVDGKVAKVRRLDGEAPRIERLKEGDTIAGLELKVAGVTEKSGTDKHGAPIDASELVAENTKTGERILLVKGLPAVTAESFALIANGDGAAPIRVKNGEEFSVAGEEGGTFQVIDVRPDQVVVREKETQKTWTISAE